MAEDTPHPLVPRQEEGTQKDIEHIVTLDSIDDAEETFVDAKDKLLDVNQWHQTAGSGSAIFQLMDGKGLLLNRKAHKGDYIRIDLPGPSKAAAGDGFDWVHIEAIIYETDPDADRECVAMRVRPTTAPVDDKNETAHFFTDEATSTFLVERFHKKLTGGIYGRNEQPNTENDSLYGKLRNGLIALGAIAGGSNAQWKALAKGWLSAGE